MVIGNFSLKVKAPMASAIVSLPGRSRIAKVKSPPKRVIIAKVKAPAQGGGRIAKVKSPSSFVLRLFH